MQSCQSLRISERFEDLEEISFSVQYYYVLMTFLCHKMNLDFLTKLTMLELQLCGDTP